MLDEQSLLVQRDMLIDTITSIKIRYKQCPTCDAKIYDSFKNYKIKNALNGALSRVEKALELINE
tara:strand:+ start:19767 stop:19961 length:195 start_codon:yes stop_codon:yes gene_type:complete